MLVVGILPTRVRDLDSTLVSRLGGIFLHLILQVSSSANALNGHINVSVRHLRHRPRLSWA